MGSLTCLSRGTLKICLTGDLKKKEVFSTLFQRKKERKKKEEEEEEEEEGNVRY